MLNPDIINGLFELLGAPFLLFSIRKLYKDKKVAGISWIHVAFFMLWGYWNLYYYLYLEQWYSFIGGIAIVIVNTVYFFQLLYYSFKKDQFLLDKTI